MSGGELCLLQHEVDQIELMTEKVLANDMCRDLIRGIKRRVRTTRCYRALKV